MPLALRTFATIALVAIGIVPCAARAQSGDRPPAMADDVAKSRDAFARGARALDDGRPKEALELFEEAYRLHPHPATLYDIGLCHRALGHPVEAVAAFSRFLEALRAPDAEPSPVSRDAVAALLVEERARIARVTIAVSPVSARVVIDGHPAASVSAAPTNPGEHVVEATAPGFAAKRDTFRAPPGSEITVDLALAPLPAAATSDVPAPAPPSGPRLDAPFWATAGVSAALIAAGAVTGGIALSDADAYADPTTPDAEAEDRRARGETLRVVADVCFVSAVVGGVVATLLATLRAPEPARAGNVSWGPSALRFRF